MKMKTLSLNICVALLAALTLASCDDSRLAKEIEGSWKGGVTSKDADGTKSDEDIMLSFSYIKSDDKDGGSYTEERDGKTIFEDEGQRYTIDYTVKIDGEYEFIAGDLYIKYDLNTLEVNIDKLHIGVTEDASLEERTDVLNSIADGSYMEIHSLIKREAKETLYHDNFVEYQQDNEDESGYLDVKVEGNDLSFETSDVGRMTLVRIK